MLLLLALLIGVIKNSSSEIAHNIAAVIATHEFSPNYPTSIVWWGPAPENIHHFTEVYKGLVVTISLNNNNEAAITKEFVFDQAVIYVKHVEEFRLMLKTVNKVSLEPIHLILVLIDESERIIEFIQVAWDNEIAHIIIVTTNLNKETMLYTFIPYSYGDCENVSPVVVPINAPSFFIRKFVNFNKCPLVVSAHTSIPYIWVVNENETISLKGFESDVINLIVERLNATLVLISNEEHERDNIANDSLKVDFSDLISHAADVMLPAVFINEKRYSVALTTYTYNDLTIVWIAPKQRVIYAWAKLILPFISRITPFITFTFLSFIAVVKIIRRYGRHRGGRNVIFQSFTLLLGFQAKFETRCRLNNTIYVLWIWYCFLIRIAYQGDLINGLHKVILEPPIRTVNDGLQTLDEVVGSAAIQELYRNTSLEKYFKVLEPNDLEKYLKRVVAGERILLAEDFVTIRGQGYLSEVQFLEESVIRLPACIFVRARWPPVDEFRRQIIAFHQHGFLVYYYYQYKARHYRRFERNHGSHTLDQKLQPLTMATLSSSFYGLLMAYFICFIICCMENIWYKIKASKVE